MRSSSARPLRLRALRFETCEDRIVLSGRPVADFFLDNSLLTQPDASLEQVEVELADVHDDFGVTYARNAFGFDGTGQTVAVIDSGVAYDHQALGGGLGSAYRVVGGWDFTEENDANPYDDGPAGFHGTHVAGIVASDDARYPGVAPGVDLVALRVFNDQGLGYINWVENALRWVHQHRDDFAYPITTVTLSLGTNWNSDSPPPGAALEDEFAQLERDGIFVSVAAGNAFYSYNTTGVSYPAASPYVVPVASVDNHGNISSFSQRNDRVLAAPGEQITSTVPDYLFSFDGVQNDFAAASGTSMATPYLAGASVLVRQALQFVGESDPDQDDIYQYLRESADIVYDATTKQSYHRIDLQATLDAIMPADEFGSTAASAEDLGTLSTTYTISGTIGHLDDLDFFRFTAGAAGRASISVTGSGDFTPAPQVIGTTAVENGETIEFDVVAGQEYVIGLGTGAGIGHYETQIEFSSPYVDLDVVDVAEFDIEGGGSYRFTAATPGLATVQVSFASVPNVSILSVLDSQGTIVAVAAATGSEAQLDFVAAADAEYVITLAGGGETAHVLITNVFEGVHSSLDIDIDDFNGDGPVDILGRSATGQWWLARGTADGFESQYAGQWNPQSIWVDVVVDDFTGDGRNDVLARNTEGKWWLADPHAANRDAHRWGTWGLVANWLDISTGDFNGDGRLDVIGRTEAGRWIVAQNTGSRFVNRSWGGWAPTAGLREVMVGDFTGDGMPDVAGRNAAGQWFVGENNGRRFITRRWDRWSPVTESSDAMTGNFTGQSLPDIVDRNLDGARYLADNTDSSAVDTPWNPAAGWSDAITADSTDANWPVLAGRTAWGEWHLSRNTNARFVNRLWESWDEGHPLPHDLATRTSNIDSRSENTAAAGIAEWSSDMDVNKLATYELGSPNLQFDWATITAKTLASMHDS